MRFAVRRLIRAALRACAISSLALLAAAPAAARAPATVEAAYRAEVRAFAQEVAERNGIAEARVLRTLRKAVLLPEVLRAIAPPADPLRRSWQDYRALFVNAARIDGGAEFWQRHAETLARARSVFGVPEEIVVAIIGIETVYGRNSGKYRVLDALATLAFAYPPRAGFFRTELEQFLILAQEPGADALSIRGSYAGAIGIPQFMPGSIRRYAVDFNGDGRTDVAGSADDAIGSVAHFLARHGWTRDLAVGWPASLSGADVEDMLVRGVKPSFDVRQAAARGIAVAVSLDLSAPAENLQLALIDLPSRAAATEYRLGSENFFALTRYNRSSFYAAAVADLAGELRLRRDHGTAPAAPPAAGAQPAEQQFSGAVR